MNIKETKKRGKFRRFGALVLAFSMIFGSATPAIAVAAETPTVVEEHAEKPAAKPAEAAKEATAKTETEAPAKAAEPVPAQAEQTPAKTEEKPAVETQAAPAKAQKNAPAEDGLEISPEVAPEGVRRGTIPAPTIDKVYIDATKVTGGNLHREKVGGKVVRATVHVTVTDKDGHEKANVSVTPKSGNTWSVDLPANVKIAEGDIVKAYQQFGENKSPETTETAQSSMAMQYKDKLKMPAGEIWVENKSSSLVNNDEQADAFEMLKKANPDIVNDIQSAKFEIGAVDKRAYFTVTYTDNSVSEKICATELTVQQVTETSRGFILDPLNVVSQTISGKVVGDGSFDGVKIELVINVNKAKMGDYCTEKKCTLDKDSSNPIMIPVNPDGSFSYTLKSEDPWNLHQVVGVAVKEPRKFKNCNTETLKLADPAVTEVRDPRKYTDKDKQAIDAAIRKANTRNGVSKLPDGTGFNKAPAIIEFDTKGNARIISPNNVNGSYSGGIFTPEKNDDGSVKVKDETQVITIPAEKLVKNIAPKSPTIAVDTATGKVTITPPAYKGDGDDTDLASYTLTYKDANGAEKTVTATLTGETWTAEGATIKAKTGVIELDVNNLEVGGTLTAKAKDNGGLEGDTDPLESELASKKLETVTVTYKPGTGDKNAPAKGTMADKLVNKGGKYQLPKGSGDFTPPTYHDFEGHWQGSDGNQYELEHPFEHLTKDMTFTPIWKLEKAKITYKPGEGATGKEFFEEYNKTQEFKLADKGADFIGPPHKEFDGWLIGKEKKAVGDEFSITEDTEAIAQWKYIVRNVHVEKNGGTGTDYDEKINDGDQFELPAKDKFTPPKNQKFSHWLVDDNEKKNPGDKITIEKDTTVKAVWVDIMWKLKFDRNGGTGEMQEQEYKQGSKVTVPGNGFTAPKDQTFDYWLSDDFQLPTVTTEDLKKNPNDVFEIYRNTTLKAMWKDIEWTITFEHGTEGTGNKDAVTQKQRDKYKLPKPDPDITAQDPKQHEFAGWSVNGSTELKQPGEEISVTSDVTLTAVWKLAKRTVIFSAGNGHGEEKKDTVQANEEITLKGPEEYSFTPPNENQRFSHWQKDNDTTTKYNKDGLFKVTEDTTFTAIWEPIPVKVKFDGNGSSDTMPEVNKNKGDTYTLPENSFGAPENKEFDTWEIDGKRVAPGTEITLKGDTTVKALWKFIQVTVTYNHGDYGTGTMDGKTVDKGSKYTLLPNAFLPADDTYEFEKWEIDGQPYGPNAEITVTKDTEVKAIWKKIQVTVSFDGNGGGGNMESETVDKRGTYELPANGFTAPNSNLMFDAWEVGGERKAPGDTITVVEDTVVKALWKKIPATITFNGNNGTGNMSPVETFKGEEYTLPKNGFTAPENKEFEGWQVGGQNKAPGDKITIEGNTEVTAIWKDIDFTVTYVANGGSGTMNPDTVLKKDGQSYQLKGNEFTPQTGWEFEGWKIGSKVYPAGANYPVTGNITATAQWRLETVGITFATEEGGEGPGNASLRHPKGVLYYLPKPEFKAKDGYQFKGWKIGNNPEIKKAGTSTTFDRDTVITAVWDQLVTVTYDANEGAWFGGNTKITNQVPKNSSFKLSWGPMRKGYVFLGWQQSEPAVQDAPTLAANGMHDGTDVPLTFKAVWREKGSSGGSDNTPGVPPVIPGTEPGTPPVTPGTEPSTPPVTPGTEPSTPSVPSDGGIPDRDALLRRLKSLWNNSEMRRLLEENAKKGQNGTAIPRAGVGTAERTVSTVLFPVDLLPAKKREED